MLHKIFTLDNGNCCNNEKRSIESILIKPENISVSSRNGGADEERVLFFQDSIYLLEHLPILRKTSAVSNQFPLLKYLCSKKPTVKVLDSLHGIIFLSYLFFYLFNISTLCIVLVCSLKKACLKTTLHCT